MTHEHLSLEERFEIATGLPMKPGIDSPFNACMYRNGCKATVDEVDALRKDAKRYRWLRDAEGALDTFTSASRNTQTTDQLNAAVDAAMAVRAA